MKNLINSIENNGILTGEEKELLIASISCGGSVSVNIRMGQTKIKMEILEILHNAEHEMTITEMQEQFEAANGWSWTVQRLSAMARQLKIMGLIEKNYITTGNSLIIKGKRYPEKIAKFSLKIS